MTKLIKKYIKHHFWPSWNFSEKSVPAFFQFWVGIMQTFEKKLVKWIRWKAG